MSGDVSFMRNATSSFDSVLTTAAPSDKAWMQGHYDRFRAYPPFFDRFLSWAPPTEFYIDAYAIYTNQGSYPGPDLLSSHPDWVLRDANGKKLYIPYACSGGTCPQYAADFGNSEWRRYFIGLIRNQLAKGYDGVHIDDVNLEMRVGNGNGQAVRPIDPRTGSPMTDSNWNRYMADFMAEVRSALPGVRISHNPMWFAPESDPNVQRQTEAADVIEMERGFNDAGLTGGTDRFSYSAYLNHVDWLHDRGKAVVFEPYELDKVSATFEVASYLLVKQRNDDMITSDFRSTPGDWWRGWEVDLGTAEGDRYTWRGVIRRDFANGMVLVNGPGSDRATVSVNGNWTSLDGDAVSGSVTLSSRQGTVLTKAQPDPPVDPPVDPPDPPDPPVVSDPGPTTAKVAIRPNKHRVRKGAKLRVRGRTDDTSGKVVLKYRTHRGWRVLKRSHPRSDGHFRTRVRTMRRGALRLRATVGDESRSRIVMVRVV